MIIAIALWLGAHVGVVTATPAVINVLAVGSILESSSAYVKGVERGQERRP